MENYSALEGELRQAQLNESQNSTMNATVNKLTTSRPATASRSANAIIKEASAFAACSELHIPSIIGTNPKMLSALISSALDYDLDPTHTIAEEGSNGLYVSCRHRVTRERLLVILKGRQFLAPSSAELQNILDEAMALMVLRGCDAPAAAAMAKRFPIAAKHDFYRTADRIVVITLVKDHLESSFSRTSANQFHYTVTFGDLWSHSVNFHFFSLRHFTEVVEQTTEPLIHPFRKWLFLFAYQAKLQSALIENNERLQTLCDEAIAEESIAMTWERTAELSRGPTL